MSGFSGMSGLSGRSGLSGWSGRKGPEIRKGELKGNYLLLRQLVQIRETILKNFENNLLDHITVLYFTVVCTQLRAA